MRWASSGVVMQRMRTSRPDDVGSTTSVDLMRWSSSMTVRGPLPSPDRSIHCSNVFHMA